MTDNQKPAESTDTPTADNHADNKAPENPSLKDGASDTPTTLPTPKKESKKPKANTKIAVKQMDATKKRIHPRFVKGKYQNIRLISMYSILLMFLAMPWFKWNGQQAILFNIAKAKLTFFGASFLPQDFVFFAFVFIIAAMMLFMVTVYAGRVWCGYACPQTIYVHLYQYTEKLIIGERNKRIKFDKEPISGKKFIKLALLHSIWLIYSVITAFTFVALVIGVDTLLFNGNPIFFTGWSKLTWFFMVLITFVTYINASYMREHMCVHICPYGRFQSVMFDKDTLIVSYDYERGEPRGATKKNREIAGLGDCVDCTMCVQVCPTGIDIRNGLQVECIQCAACIDACNDIMDKLDKPRGLIRYTTERQLVEKQKTKIISWRIFAYIFVLCLLFGAATYMFLSREPLSMEIRHDRRQLSAVGRDGRIENSYILKIVNKTDSPHTYQVRLDEPTSGVELRVRFKELKLKANESYNLPVSLYADANQIGKGKTPITITVYSTDGQYSNSQSDFFIVDE